MVRRMQNARTVTQPGTGFPTKAEIARTYRSLARAALDNKKARLLATPPEGWQDAPHFDITPPGREDAYAHVYVIQDRLYLSQTAFTQPNPSGFVFRAARWYDIGPAPLFGQE